MTELTDTGYIATTNVERREAVVARLRGSHATLASVTFEAASPEGQIVDAFVEMLTDVDEAAEAAYNSLDPDKATTASAAAIARLRGVRIRAATKSQVDTTCDLDAATYPAGTLIAFVVDEPDNRWSNVAEVVSTGGANAVPMQAEAAGKAPTALAGTLTQLVAVAGWNTCTNAADSLAGRDQDTNEVALFRSEGTFYTPQQNGITGVRAEVLEVEGVIDAIVDNSSGSILVTVWDGPGIDASNDDIAAAIWAHLPPGIATTGAISNTSVGAEVKFSRALAVPLYAKITVTGSGIEAAAVKLAAQAALPQLLGGTVRWAAMSSLVFNVPGVTDVPELLLDDDTPPVQETDNFTAGSAQWFELDGSNIEVVGAS